MLRAGRACTAREAPKLELKIYNLSDLVDSRQEFPYTGDLPAASGAPAFMSGLQSGYGGGIGEGQEGSVAEALVVVASSVCLWTRSWGAGWPLAVTARAWAWAARWAVAVA